MANNLRVFLDEAICPICKKVFSPKKVHRYKYCSLKCYKKCRRKGKLIIKKECAWCNKVFYTHISTQKCCKRSCKDKYLRALKTGGFGKRICKCCGKKFDYKNNMTFNSICFCSKKCLDAYTTETVKHTKLMKYGNENYNNQEKMKQTKLIRYGDEHFNNYKSISKKAKQNAIAKSIDTRRKRNNFNSSSAEKQILELLNLKFSKCVKYQYRSEKYPFACDFYIPELDLYIEYQGHWTHGHFNSKIYGPFDPSNILHQDLLNKWKSRCKSINKRKDFYQIAIEVWTIRDPLKRKIAKENNLNWIEFFSMKEFLEWYNKE